MMKMSVEKCSSTKKLADLDGAWCSRFATVTLLTEKWIFSRGHLKLVPADISNQSLVNENIV